MSPQPQTTAQSQQPQTTAQSQQHQAPPPQSPKTELYTWIGPPHSEVIGRETVENEEGRKVTRAKRKVYMPGEEYRLTSDEFLRFEQRVMKGSHKNLKPNARGIDWYAFLSTGAQQDIVNFILDLDDANACREILAAEQRRPSPRREIVRAAEDRRVALSEQDNSEVEFR